MSLLLCFRLVPVRLAAWLVVGLQLCACNSGRLSLIQVDVELAPQRPVSELRVHVHPPKAGPELRFEVPEGASRDEVQTVPLGFYVSVEAATDMRLELSAWDEEVQQSEVATIAVVVKPGQVIKAASPVRLQMRIEHGGLGGGTQPDVSDDLPEDGPDDAPKMMVDAGSPEARPDAADPCSASRRCMPPTVLSTSPARGETGVAPSAMLIVVFTEPMDKLSVQKAFTASSGIKLGPTSFAWNDIGNEMIIRPVEAMPMAIGGPDVGALELSFSLSTHAMSLHGLPLAEAVTIPFRTLRHVTARCEVISELSALLYSSGVWNIRSSYEVGTFKTAEAAPGWDTGTALSFDCNSLPNALRDVDQALLHFLVRRSSAEARFRISADHVRFDSFDSNVYAQTPLRRDVARTDDTSDGWKRLDVTPATREDVNERLQRHGRSQFRLGALGASVLRPDEISNVVGIGTSGEGAPYLEVRYLAP